MMLELDITSRFHVNCEIPLVHFTVLCYIIVVIRVNIFYNEVS